ncbi:hypothetical protein MPH_10383 [Macrophomina phaseolina MS6]|uniref:Uncharacterized protein n=1 Tax=Macrophomina phaseolina (strain MS6) TaxID=1126212 RepID=K2RD97_MACPH|nr:hypothetical protein MPH_10383 [Macrophomina phaseolina MS6]
MGADRVLHKVKPSHALDFNCALCSTIAFSRPDYREDQEHLLVQVHAKWENPGSSLTVLTQDGPSTSFWTPREGRTTSRCPGSLAFFSGLHPCVRGFLGRFVLVDFSVVKGWMNRCKTDHGESCKGQRSATTIPNSRLLTPLLDQFDLVKSEIPMLHCRNIGENPTQGQ